MPPIHTGSGDSSRSSISFVNPKSCIIGSATDWIADNVDGPSAAPDGYFIALDGARLVGCTSVSREGDDTLRIALTGVLPAYRRRGSARALTRTESHINTRCWIEREQGLLINA